MADRDFTMSLPADLVTRMQAGEVEQVTDYLVDVVRHQVRREAILDYLATCQAAGHPEVTDADLREFRKLVGEEAA
ncbi:hypothetical protein JQS43_12670 [Natronosporangium hydrolyticum]|uniref:Uncharacterized protein n=1 Tax=Natronosporangium hydrolyticum TaxID=2811111 RepID=A0A895YB73_9ACTN|nr:hypothetical protein [Natronosporangium hydrolyticum]QSB12579.1 hypothetical protein JQS43_12670 [Natronosporangium hydrolyticum]